MKTLTDTQKKWALTACLLTALSFNLSAHIKADKEVSRDFASEGIAFDVTNSKGMRDAKAWKSGDDGEYTVKVEAAPGCNCDGETVEIKVQTDKQGEDLKNLIKVATYAKLEEKSTKSKDKDDKDDEESEDDEDLSVSEKEMRDEKFKKEFARLIKSCGHEDDVAKEVRCRASALTGFLKKYKKAKEEKRPSEELVTDFLRDEVQEKIAEVITQTEPVIEDYTSYSEYRRAVSEYNSNIRAGKNALISLQENIPSGYNKVRRELTSMVANIQQIAARKYADTLTSLKNSQNPNNYQQTIATATQYQTQFNQLTSELDSLVNAKCTLRADSPVCEAVRNKNISKSDAQNIYRTEYSDVVGNISAQANDSVVTEILKDQNGRIITDQYGAPQVRSYIRPQVFSTSAPIQTADLNREGGRTSSVVIKSPTNKIVYIGDQAYQAVETVTTQSLEPEVIRTTSAVSWSNEMDAPPESLRIRDALHRQYRTN